MGPIGVYKIIGSLAGVLDLGPGKGLHVQSNIQLQIDLQQFFQYYKVLNARHLAEKIGMNPTLLSQYVSGKKKPSQAQSHRIMVGIQNIGKELAALSFLS